MDPKLKKQLLRTCAWCNQVIPPDAETFGFGAKTGANVDLTGKEGEFVTLKLAISGKIIIALVPSEGSIARDEGYDLVFITCSPECAEELKENLQLEKDVFKD